MALKTVIASVEDVSEDLRDLYIEKDGSFILDLEAVDAHPPASASGVTDAELGNGANWTRAYDPKLVRMVAVTTNG